MIGAPRDYDLLDGNIGLFRLKNLIRIDWVIPAVVMALAIVGFLSLYSASRSTTTNHCQRQIIFFLVGATVAVVLICMDHRFLVSLAPVLYGGAVILLLGVLYFGKEVKGGQRWLEIGPFRVQPSEQTKLIVVYMLTWYFGRIGERIRKFPYLVLAFIIAGVPAILILKQPNLGTAAVLGPVVFVMIYMAGCKARHLVLIVIAGLSVVPWVAWQMYSFEPHVKPMEPAAFYELKYHQKMRIHTFLDPEANIQGDGWQTYQSKVTIGSGGLRGKGFCQGTQTYLRYLPEHHNDFIFSLVAEESGFIGAVSVLSLFLILFLRGLASAQRCTDLSGGLLAAGAITILAFHVFVNIAITAGLLPVTGIPLPFLSSGGSFYLTTMMCIGVLLSVPVKKRLFE